MNRLAPCAAVLVPALACAAPAAAPDYSADAAAIARTTEEWAAAFKAGDAVGAASYMTSGGMLVPPNEPSVTGVSAVEAWARNALGMMTVNDVQSLTDSVLVAGDWAVSRGAWILTITGGGATVTDTSRYVVIWERQADGSWKAAYDLWNVASSVPASGSGAGGS